MKIFNKILASIYWGKAVYYISRGDSKAGLNMLQKIHSLGEMNVEYYILKGFGEGAVGNYRESIRYLSQSVSIIEKSDSLNLNDSEKEYLKRYSRSVMLDSSECLGMENQKLKLKIDEETIDISKVRKVFLKNYPMPNLCRKNHDGIPNNNIKPYSRTPDKNIKP